MRITTRLRFPVTALKAWRRDRAAVSRTTEQQPLLKETTEVASSSAINSHSKDIDRNGTSGVQAKRAHAASPVAREVVVPAKGRALQLTQVITDIDDTVKCSGGVQIAGIPLGGIDTRYARGDFYPGVFQFALELSLHSFKKRKEQNKKRQQPTSSGEKNNRTTSKAQEHKHCPPLPVAVLTARARELKFALKIRTRSAIATMFREAGARAGYDEWGLGPVLYGSIAEWVCQSRKGRRKFRNFERLMQLQQEFFETQNIAVSYVYMGDTGEMDADAAQRMIDHYPDLVRGVFLHAVGDEHHDDFELCGVPVRFFRTYISAARKAVQSGLLDLEALVRVMESAERDALEQAEAVLRLEPLDDLADALENQLCELSDDGDVLSCPSCPTSRTLRGFYDKSVPISCLQLRLAELERDYNRSLTFIKNRSGGAAASYAHLTEFSAAEVFDKALENCLICNYDDSPQP